ncbi:uncharacterized protein EV420DRAFT_1626274 [Desarmillaria tabescens]|uniref:Gfo/Idh/MocA-like oxidoreductase N-terminal domain-containing protein n=1 Tax=Armillaria tabescens TaxID=1929756 RepID=A0AA39TWF7_ARMTA|nr:uncharacterized protein EV420DRAFT_1626274 [Desarmillaria tabescens]KAK0468448.1 hypothetical protein EV420DRAFT_1626274 [Desarmillaria tabescens]
MTGLLATSKSLWQRSWRSKQSPYHSAMNDLDEKQPSAGPVTLAVIGCGQRGKAYAKYALQYPDRCKVVAIAEPRSETQKHFADLHSVDNTLVFRTWRDLHAASAETLSTIGKRLADAVIIAVQDHMHVEVTEAFTQQGYHILCEKPMATNIEDCIRMETAIKKAGIIFGMGHVMRYSPYSQEISEIVQAGRLGRLINLVQIEPVGYYHFAHSYVRGNWAKEANSSFSLMTKSCHDIDIICHWLSPSTPIRHFRKSSKPAEAGATTRCVDCSIEKTCPYSAKRIYLDPVSKGNKGWPAETIVDGIPDIENIAEALKSGPYGKCVYESDNDVCDNQVVNLEFDNGSTASFTMVAFTSLICDRQLRMHFTHGEIVGDMNKFTVTDFRTRTTTTHVPKDEGGGHGGGDLGLIRSFIKAVRAGDQKVLGTDIAEITSRKEGRVIDCVEYEKLARERVAAKV